MIVKEHAIRSHGGQRKRKEILRLNKGGTNAEGLILAKILSRNSDEKRGITAILERGIGRSLD